MELRTIRYFLAVAEHGSLSAAAQAAFVSQPSLSRQMADLEKELGNVLFDRTASGLKLNHAGQRFLPMAIDIERRASSSRAVMRSLGGERLHLVIACPFTVMQHALAPFIAQTGAPIGDVREFEPTSVYAQLENTAVDVAIGTSRPPAAFESRRIMTPQLTVQCVRTHPFAARTSVDVRELADEDLIVVRRGSSIRSILDAAAEHQELSLTYAHQVSSSTIAQALAASGQGCAVAVAPAQFDLAAIPLTDGDAPLHITDWAAWNPAHYAAAEIARVVDDFSVWLHESALEGMMAQVDDDTPRA